MIGRSRASVGLVAACAALLVGCGAALADTTTGLLDVSKQVTKIQQQVSALIASGQATKTGSLSLTAVCGDRPTARYFLPWGDLSQYTLAPGGGLETSAGWSLDNKSRLVADNAPLDGGVTALLFGDSGGAASPSICVSTLHPTVRFFAKNTGSLTSTLKVSVLYEGTDGHVHELAIARLVGGHTWFPTPVLPYYVNLIAAASPAGVTAIAFKFKAEGTGGNWTIDDLFVDPVKIT